MAATDGPPDASDTIAVRRGRREKKKSRASSALEKIRRGRETGVREETELEAPEQLFDYVTEDEYSRLVQKRQTDGFILDDDGSYSEHGREIFDQEGETGGEGDHKKKGPPGGKVKSKVAKPGGIKAMVMGMGGVATKKREENKASIVGDDLLADMLHQMESGPSTSSPHSSSKFTTPRRKPLKFTPRHSSTPSNPPHCHPSPGHSSNPSPGHSLTKRVKMVKKEDRSPPPHSSPPPPSPPPQPHWDDTWDGEMADDGCHDDQGTVAKEEERETVEPEKPSHVPEAAVSVSGWETVRGDLPSTEEVSSVVMVTSSDLPTQEVDGEEVLLFYWLDACEMPYHQPGTVYLFGKIWVESAATHVSCCVVVKDIPRCLYFLPREKVLGTETPVTFEALYSEFNMKYAEPQRIMKFTSRRVTRHYAFDQSDVPQESEYLQVVYSAEYQAPPIDASGKTFSRVFGTTTSSLEHLVLSCHLKGPCWLHILQPKRPQQSVSWCRMECVIGGIENVKLAPLQAPPPPLVTMSLSFTLTLNTKTHTNEVLCVGGLVHSAVGLNKPPPKNPFQNDFCTIRRPVDRNFPFGFEELLKSKRFNVQVAPSERALLAYLLAKIHRIDPDIIVGHNLMSYQLAVLQHRLAACKVPQWSRTSRLRRKDMPKGRWAGSQLCAGRPVCDVMTSARELIRARSYDLTELCRCVLGKQHKSLEQDDILHSFTHSEQLYSLVAHTMEEAMLSLQLMYELNVLPLAYQITCIAGNILSRTLAGGRAERNEHLLLHAFSSKDYICPDKVATSRKHQVDEEEEGGGAAGVKGRRKPAYTGGLVLEPKKGFYDTFILLLDYNSLYPSIIQEYNICFTTVDHAHFSADADDYSQLQLPDPSLPPGVLPAEIRVLVERRRQVKQLMKGCVAGSEEYAQYDIRQKALKLTANSMYGCLGFTHSRFYAKPLAALITGKGREILSHTKELAEKLGLDVIYGDTDSVMINSHSHSLTEAQAIAQRFKREVNKLYRLLEIDVDGIFQTMLLLKKKKYAAKTVEIRDGHKVYGTELKGLDVVRRDWCELAKGAGHHVLDSILSGRSLDDVIDEVKTFLQQLSHDVEVDKVALEDYIITKSLTKNPDDYPDKRSLPHVQVALRMQSRGKHVQSGDVIPYVMCKSDQSLVALSAFHPDELRASDQLQLDRAYYLRHQLHAVVSRLCEPIDGLDSAQIASCLGMDPSGFRGGGGRGGEGEGEEGRGDRFRDCQLPTLTCPACAKLVPVAGATASPREDGLKCVECKVALPVAVVMNSLTLTIKSLIRQYYVGWMICDDRGCQFRSRSVPVGVGGVSCPLCRHGKMQEELTASIVCRQLQFYMCRLFPSAPGNKYKKLRETVTSFLDWNAYSRVDLSRVFPVLQNSDLSVEH